MYACPHAARISDCLEYNQICAPPRPILMRAWRLNLRWSNAREIFCGCRCLWWTYTELCHLSPWALLQRLNLSTLSSRRLRHDGPVAARASKALSQRSAEVDLMAPRRSPSPLSPRSPGLEPVWPFAFTQHLAEVCGMMPGQVAAVSWKWRPTVPSSGEDGRRPSCPAGRLTVVLGWSATDTLNNAGPCVCSVVLQLWTLWDWMQMPEKRKESMSSFCSSVRMNHFWCCHRARSLLVLFN